jgi:hypothetical protein
MHENLPLKQPRGGHSPRITVVLLFPTCLADTKSSLVRERSRLCNLVFRSDTAARILKSAASHERCSDPLQQGNSSRHQQVFPTRRGEEYAPWAAVPYLVKTPPHLLDQLEGHAKQCGRASWTTTTDSASITTTPAKMADHDTATQPALSDSDLDLDSDTPSIPVHVGRASSVIGSWRHTTATATALVRPSDSDSWCRDRRRLRQNAETRTTSSHLFDRYWIAG